MPFIFGSINSHSGGDDWQLLAILRQHGDLLWMGGRLHHPPSTGLCHARHAPARNCHRPLNVSNPPPHCLLSSGVTKVAADCGKVEEGCSCVEPGSCLESSTSCTSSPLLIHLSIFHRVFQTFLLFFSPVSPVFSPSTTLPRPHVLLLALFWHGLLWHRLAHP